MKKIYFIIPIVLLAVFVFFYLGAQKGIHDREVAKQAQDQKDREARQRQEEEARKKAYEDANKQALERIAEINARQAEEKRQTEERQAATDVRDIAFRERESLSKQVNQLTSDLQVAKEQKDKVEEQLKIQKTQVDYLKTAAADVAQTKSVFENALNKLDNAERAFTQLQAQQAAAAAAAIKK
jgi:chromosome segregation ATPase